MKKFFLVIALFVCASNVQAQVTDADSLMALGMSPELAEQVAKIAAIPNGEYLSAEDESGNVHDILGVDSSGNTELLAPTGEDIEATAGTDFDITATAGDVNITASGDDVTITATDDVVIQGQGSGDVVTIAGGGTAVDLTIADNAVTVATGTLMSLASSTAKGAAGSSISDATDLTEQIEGITGASGTNGVQLQDAAIGVPIFVSNINGSNALLVYPHDGSSSINNGSNGAAVSLAVRELGIFVRTSSTTWHGGAVPNF